MPLRCDRYPAKTNPSEVSSTFAAPGPSRPARRSSSIPPTDRFQGSPPRSGSATSATSAASSNVESAPRRGSSSASAHRQNIAPPSRSGADPNEEKCREVQTEGRHEVDQRGFEPLTSPVRAVQR